MLREVAMTKRAVCLMAFLTSACVLSPASGFAETVLKIEATGVGIIDLQNFKHADGSTAQLFTTRSVWTFTEGDFAGTSAGVTCHGLGNVTAEGVYSGQLLCEETYSATDTTTTNYVDGPTGGDWVIIGGTGKYKGAKGGGHVTYTWGDAVFGDKVTMTNEGTITLP